MYRSYSSTAAKEHWGGNELVDAPSPTRSSAGLVDALDRAGADALNLRVHVPGVSPDGRTEQIAAPRPTTVLGPIRAARAD